MQAVAVLAVLALAYQTWRSRWLWGQPDAGPDARAAASVAAVAAVAGDPLGAALDRYLARLAAFGYSGSALVARGGRVLLHRGYGLADRARGVPYTAETLFDVASISKQFTAAAILALEMDGKLKVEDTLGRFFPVAPEDKAAITLHQLLTHTSGLRDTFGEEYETATREELLRRVFASQLLSRPGRRYRYSNGGYSVLAAVVEVASGQSYGAYLRERLFERAGMRSTGFRLPPRQLALLAHGYTADGDWGTPLDHPWAPDGPWWILRGNGGILSTTGDLYRWHLALAGDAVLARPQREKYVTPYVSEGRWAHTDYAYGWSVGKSPTGKREISHIGGNGAFESDFRRYVGDGAVIILSGNSIDYSALAIGDHLENRLFGLPDADPPAVAAPPVDPPVPGAAAAAARCGGVYLLPAPGPGAGAGGDGGARPERLTVTLDTAPATPTPPATAPAGRLLVAADGKQGMALLLGALGADDRDLVAGRDANVVAALDAAREGRLQPFAKLMGVEADAAADLLRSRVGPLAGQLGAWTGVAGLGGAARGGRWFTYARCDFARGTRIAELGWAGPTAETLRFLDALPGQRFVPAPPPGAAAGTAAATTTTPPAAATTLAASAAATFAAFDVRTGVTVRAACELPAAGGPASALTLRSGDGAPVRAARGP